MFEDEFVLAKMLLNLLAVFGIITSMIITCKSLEVKFNKDFTEVTEESVEVREQQVWPKLPQQSIEQEMDISIPTPVINVSLTVLVIVITAVAIIGLVYSGYRFIHAYRMNRAEEKEAEARADKLVLEADINTLSDTGELEHKYLCT